MNSEKKITITNNNNKDPCKKIACELQYCLQANNYNQIKCESIVQKLVDCCQLNYSNNNKLNVSDTCSGFLK